MRRTLLLVMWTSASITLIGCDADGTFVPSTTVNDTVEDGGMVWPDMQLSGEGGSSAWTAPKVMYAHSGDTLFRIDPDTRKVTTVGTFHPSAPHMNDLAVTPDGKLYAVSSNNLYQVDPTDASITWVTKVPGSTNVALTFDVDGTLLSSDKAGNFRRVDPASGNSIPIGSYGAGLGSSGDLVALKDGKLYEVNDVNAKGNNTLVTVDPKTGKASTVGPIGFRMVWGLSFWGGTLYGFTRLGEFISIDPKSGHGSLIHTFTHEFWGAAVTPKAPLTLK
jgi:hypothetical protein